MQQEIHLYIDNKEVFFSEPPEILFTFQRVDYTNPTAIKNNFTKTITIEGVPQNNIVFNEIWKLDRTQDSSLFNPSKRVPFELFCNGTKIETGYAKLDNINRKGYKVEYEVTLYGGLGDFFYGLSYGFDYDSVRKVEEDNAQAEDEELKLKDLTYISAAEDDDTEFNFAITKDAVKSAWERLRDKTDSNDLENKWDFINFAPAYNGLPDDFDSDKVLINTNDYQGGCRISVPAGATVDGTTYSTQQIIEKTNFPTSIEVDGNTYNAQNGFALSELRESLTEWEIRDLRSYLQRPVLRVKGMFEAIKRYVKTKGEYTLELDENFFNKNNPYYDKAWITLPMLQNLNGEYAETEATGSLQVGTMKSYQEVDDGFSNELYRKKSIMKYDIVGLPTASTYKNANISISLAVNANQIFWQDSVKKLSTTHYISQYGGYNYPWYLSNFDVQLLAYDDSGAIVGRSDHHCFTTKSNGMVYDTRWNYYKQSIGGVNAQVHLGFFESNSPTTGSGNFVFTSDDGYNTTSFGISMYGSREFSRLELIVTKYIQYTSKFLIGMPNEMDLYKLLIDEYSNIPQGVTDIYKPWNVSVYNNRITNSSVTYTPDNDTMKSYQLITKKKLLSQDGTPCKYMIDYCKLFNLYFDKDPIEKKVTIRTRPDFYDTQIINLDNKIDRKQTIDIKPIAFDSKWYTFNYTEGDKSDFAQKYYNTYGTDYGKHKVNTGYNFDNSSTDLLDGNIYKNAVEVLEKSKYYQSKFKARIHSGTIKEYGIPTFLQEWSDYKLFNITESSVETPDEFYIGLPTNFGSRKLNENGLRYDMMPKLQFHSEDNAPIDGSNVLVFFNGMKPTKVGDTNNYIKYYITDDTASMYTLNSNQSCWLYTDSTTDVAGNTIANLLMNRVMIGEVSVYPILPNFTRNIVLNNSFISYTFDFGKDNLLYVPNYKYINEVGVTIYERFWNNYISDLYDKTTRIVNCYVKLDGKVEGDWLKHFYYFDNSIWCLTKIEDYNVTSFGTTKCEFAKVVDIDDYRNWIGYGLPLKNISLWIEPYQDQEYVEVFRFKISESLRTDLEIEYTYNYHYPTTSSFTRSSVIRAGSVTSENIELVLQDFDCDSGGDAELTSIKFKNSDGEYVVNNFVDGNKWLYLDRSKFNNFIDSLNNVDNNYGVSSITEWGSQITT